MAQQDQGSGCGCVSVAAFFGVALLVGGIVKENLEAEAGGELLIGLVICVRFMQRLFGGSGPAKHEPPPATAPAPIAAEWSQANGLRSTPASPAPARPPCAPEPSAASPTSSRDGTGRFTKR